MALMVSISGIRGIVGTSLTPDVALAYVSAFGHLKRKEGEKPNHQKIVLGQDSRPSGEGLITIVKGILIAQGYYVYECGIVPTPTVQVLVQQLHADGGIIVTASHNPEPWNGLKFVDSDGLFLSPELNQVLFGLVNNKTPLRYESQFNFGSSERLPQPFKDHLSLLQQWRFSNFDVIQKRKFKIVIDTINGAGGPILKSLLSSLSCEAIFLNYDTTGRFSHAPEPIPENLSSLCSAVVEHQADLGIAVDPDVDRCVLIDETGKPIGEEYTLTIAVYFYFKYVYPHIKQDLKETQYVVKNLSTTRAVDDVVKNLAPEVKVIATAVGEIHVAKEMERRKALIGGEGNGGVMLPDIHIGRDAMVSVVMCLQCLAFYLEEGKGKSMGEMKRSLPEWQIVKMKVGVEAVDVDRALGEIVKEWKGKEGVEVSEVDGVRIDWSGEGAGWWVHLRRSNTEPIVRVIGEARTGEEAQKVCGQFMDKILEFKK